MSFAHAWPTLPDANANGPDNSFFFIALQQSGSFLDRTTWYGAKMISEMGTRQAVPGGRNALVAGILIVDYCAKMAMNNGQNQSIPAASPGKTRPSSAVVCV